MKQALKILNDLKIAKQVLILSHDTSSFSNEIERKKLEKINEAIEELEELQNRKCTDCKFFTKDGVFYGICAKDVNTTQNQDLWLSNVEFLCNRFEVKDK